MGTIDTSAVVRTAKDIGEAFEERSVDMNIVLPDYYPPISAILKCIMIPVICNRCQSGDRYNVDGETTVRLLYISEERDSVHCYEAVQPFSVSFPSEDVLHHYTCVKSDYVNCRAVAPRRVDVRGSFRVGFGGLKVQEMTVAADPMVNGCYCKSERVHCSVPVCEAEKVITVDEAVDLGISVDRLLYSEACIVNTECKVFTNKLIAKGVLRVKAVCAKGDELHTTLQEIPFSQILDVDGLDERWLCLSEMTVGENETYLQQSEGGGALLFVKFKVIICARLLCDTEIDSVLDAYHTEYPLICETTPLSAVVYCQPRAIHTTETAQLPCPEHVTACMDVWGQVKSCEVRCVEGQSQMLCCLGVGFIAKGEEDHPEYYERTIDVVQALDGESVSVNPCIASVSASVINHSLRVQVEMVTECMSIQRRSFSAVSRMIANEADRFPENEASLRLAYVHKGETMWDVAKRHRASVRDIMEENQLTHETITEPQILMIPLL